MLIKYLTRKKIGFNSDRVTFNAIFVFSVIAFLFGALPYWLNNECQIDLLIIGIISGNAACLGIVLLNKAYNSGGPAGPVTAISALSSPCLVIIIAIKDGKMISLLELIGVILAMFGVLIMTNH